MNLLTKQKQTPRLWEWASGCQGEGLGEEIGNLGMGMYMLLYFKWIANKDILYSTGNSAQCYMAAWMGEEFEGKWIYVYVWLSPIAIHLKQSQHCLSTDYTLIQNKSFFFLRNKTLSFYPVFKISPQI